MGTYTIIQYFQFSCNLLGFIYSIRTINNKDVVGYMKGFYYYSLVAVCLTSVLMFDLIGDNEILHLTVILNKISFLFHYIFLSVFIYRTLNTVTHKKIFIILFFVFLLIVLTTICKTVSQSTSFLINSLTNFFLVIFCLIYYYDLFNGIPVKNLFNQSSFWVVTGLFLCLSVAVPLNVLKTLFLAQSNSDLNLFVTSIAVFFYSVMHLFFIKAYLCSINPSQDL